MKIIWRFAPALFVLVSILALYKSWFGLHVLTAPDISFYFPSRLAELGWLPHAWSSVFGNGLGASTSNIFYLDMYLHFGVSVLVTGLGLPWVVASRLLFFWPFLLLGGISSYLLTAQFVKQKQFVWLGSLVYLSNTYILMLASGGQMGLVMAYATAPLVLVGFMKKQTLLLAVSAILTMIFDLRFTYILSSMIVLYVGMVIPMNKWFATLKFTILPALLTIGFHSVWIFPSLLSRSFHLPEGYGDPVWLSYLSWADFSKTFSLLHPNWPDNMFGKTYFTRPEFILIPILIYSGVLLIDRVRKSAVSKESIWLLVVSLAGAFFATGVNNPFGFIYEWLFIHIPFFNAFRDPTKFYFMIAISYSVLIPYALSRIADALSTRHPKIKETVSAAIFGLFVTYWTIVVLPAFNGTVTGTFTSVAVPADYHRFEEMLSKETDFSRTLAVPWHNRFIYESENHPVVDARGIFQINDIAGIITSLSAEDSGTMLSRLAIRYVVIPVDITAEVFLTDRAYDDGLRQQTIAALDRVPYLSRKSGFDRLVVYQVNFPAHHVYQMRDDGKILPSLVSRVDPSRYVVELSDPQPGPVVFSERYDPNWQAWDGTKTISSQKSQDGLNSFVLDSPATSLEIRYKPQQYVDRFRYMTGITILALVILILVRLTTSWKSSRRRWIICVCLALGLLYIYTLCRSHNRIQHAAVLWDRAWKTQAGSVFPLSRITTYGGSAASVFIHNSSFVRVIVSGVNTQQGTDIEFRVNDVKATPVATGNGPLTTLTLTPNLSDYSLDIRAVCSGEPGCRIGVHSIQIAPFGFFRKSSSPDTVFAVLGDSISTMYGLENYSYLLSERLNMQLRNAGVNRSTLSKSSEVVSGVDRYIADIVDGSPDTVLIALGTNDALRGVDLATFRKDYETVLSGIRKAMPQVRVYTMSVLRSPTISKIRVLAYNDIIHEVSRKLGAQYIDVYDLLSPSDFPDGLHPSKESHVKIAQAIYTLFTNERAQ